MSYITFSNLGESGGMGSQLQSYASLTAVAKANNKQIVFSESMIKRGFGIKVFELLNIPILIKPDEFFKDFKLKNINFHTTTYDETLFSLDSSNYNLNGRFDLYTYWYNDIKDEIKNWKYNDEIQNIAQQEFNTIQSKLGKKPTVSIHMRRGDYLLPHHSFCELKQEYFLKAITSQFMPSTNFNFLVFSNDIEYSKSVLEGDNVWFVEPKGVDTQSFTTSEKEDLALLSLCDNHIISNSSYSWWGAFLSKNKNKKIICPTNYVEPSHPSSWINGNYFPPNWINIDN
jgi:hypothetical protein|tara:strand:+ start:1590 stop:2447 length:858 start_codon:yes stop_codon:yes gene_type:complete